MPTVILNYSCEAKQMCLSNFKLTNTAKGCIVGYQKNDFFVHLLHQTIYFFDSVSPIKSGQAMSEVVLVFWDRKINY